MFDFFLQQKKRIPQKRMYPWNIFHIKIDTSANFPCIWSFTKLTDCRTDTEDVIATKFVKEIQRSAISKNSIQISPRSVINWWKLKTATKHLWFRWGLVWTRLCVQFARAVWFMWEFRWFNSTTDLCFRYDTPDNQQQQ